MSKLLQQACLIFCSGFLKSMVCSAFNIISECTTSEFKLSELACLLCVFTSFLKSWCLFTDQKPQQWNLPAEVISYSCDSNTNITHLHNSHAQGRGVGGGGHVRPGLTPGASKVNISIVMLVFRDLIFVFSFLCSRNTENICSWLQLILTTKHLFYKEINHYSAIKSAFLCRRFSLHAKYTSGFIWEARF